MKNDKNISTLQIEFCQLISNHGCRLENIQQTIYENTVHDFLYSRIETYDRSQKQKLLHIKLQGIFPGTEFMLNCTHEILVSFKYQLNYGLLFSMKTSLNSNEMTYGVNALIRIAELLMCVVFCTMCLTMLSCNKWILHRKWIIKKLQSNNEAQNPFIDIFIAFRIENKFLIISILLDSLCWQLSEIYSYFDSFQWSKVDYEWWMNFSWKYYWKIEWK